MPAHAAWPLLNTGRSSVAKRSAEELVGAFLCKRNSPDGSEASSVSLKTSPQLMISPMGLLTNVAFEGWTHGDGGGRRQRHAITVFSNSLQF